MSHTRNPRGRARTNLEVFRDWARACAGDTTRPPRERALWDSLASEIDHYLSPVPDPAHDDRTIW